jgi:hypothetical protein
VANKLLEDVEKDRYCVPSHAADQVLQALDGHQGEYREKIIKIVLWK